MNDILKLNRKKAINYLTDFANGLQPQNDRALDTIFNKRIQIGHGDTKNFVGDKSHIRIGIGGLSGKSKLAIAPVDDLTFTRTIVTLYHEYDHYLQNYGPEKNISNMISEISVAYNFVYYRAAWKELPHEIHAEATGVALAWDAIEHAFPHKADACMLEYVNFRAEHTSYMIPKKESGYGSREEIMDAFKTAMENSLSKPRTPLGGFLKYPDESIQLLTQGHDFYTRSPNAHHVDKLIDTIPGAKKDRMMAALILQIHPDMLDETPRIELKSENLTVEHEFGRPLKVKTLPGQYASRQIDDELAHAFETYGSTTNDYVDDFDFKT